MSRAKTVAQAAWARPSLQLSSWSCIGPRRRNVSSITSAPSEDSRINASLSAGASSVPLLTGTEATTTEREQILKSEVTAASTLITECSLMVGQTTCHVTEIEKVEESNVDTELSEVELWQQLETELSKPREREEGEDDDEEEEENDIVREIADASTSSSEVGTASNSSLSETKEVHRFYPPGKIMHIVSFLPEEDENIDHEGARHEEGSKMGIYLTPRSLYGKLRLSKTMINDHYMPIYRRSMEQLISELEKDACLANGEKCVT
jgi:hypothetical protein